MHHPARGKAGLSWGKLGSSADRHKVSVETLKGGGCLKCLPAARFKPHGPQVQKADLCGQLCSPPTELELHLRSFSSSLGT